MLKNYKTDGPSGSKSSIKEDNAAPAGVLSSHNQRTHPKEEIKSVVSNTKAEQKSPPAGEEQSDSSSTSSKTDSQSEKPAGIVAIDSLLYWVQ